MLIKCQLFDPDSLNQVFCSYKINSFEFVKKLPSLGALAQDTHIVRVKKINNKEICVTKCSPELFD